MKKRAYIHRETGEIKEFSAKKKPREPWVFLPPMSRFINDDGKFVLRVKFDDYTMDIIEQDVPIEKAREMAAIDGEVVDHGNAGSN